MLRRKFLIALGGMVAMLLATALTAILLLHGLLRDLHEVEAVHAAAELYAAEAAPPDALAPGPGTQHVIEALTARFRLVALALGLVFVFVINVSILVLSRMVSMVVKPVDRLIDASRRLAREEFDSRVELEQLDEFGELAQAYNSLAAQLQASEQRKVETLHQVACTLNHELNNAIAIIELQLSLMARAARGDDAQAARLREIHQTLARISRTVQNLAHVRRIVLTDYTAGGGVRMLDIEQSLDLTKAPAGPMKDRV